jgi:hypothetical protein
LSTLKYIHGTESTIRVRGESSPHLSAAIDTARGYSLDSSLQSTSINIQPGENRYMAGLGVVSATNFIQLDFTNVVDNYESLVAYIHVSNTKEKSFEVYGSMV